MKRQHTPVYWVAVAAAVGVAIGSFGPWVSVLGFTENGLDKDGVLTLPAAIGALAGLIHHDRKGTRGGLIAALILGALTTLIGIIDYLDISGNELGDLAQVEWGLYLVCISAIVLTAAAAALFARYRRDGAGTASPPPTA